MDFPTQPCFVAHAKGYDATLLQHPVPRFMRECSDEILFEHKDEETMANQSTP